MMADNVIHLSDTDYMTDMDRYIDIRNWMSDFVKNLGRHLEKIEGVEADNHFDYPVALKAGNKIIGLSVTDYPYPPGRPEGMMAGVRIEHCDVPRDRILGINLPFTKHATSNPPVLAYGNGSPDNASIKKKFAHDLTECVTDAFKILPGRPFTDFDSIMTAGKAALEDTPTGSAPKVKITGTVPAEASVIVQAL